MPWYSLEAPRRGTSNEYPQHMFSWRNKKNINQILSKPMLDVDVSIFRYIQYTVLKIIYHIVA